MKREESTTKDTASESTSFQTNNDNEIKKKNKNKKNKCSRWIPLNAIIIINNKQIRAKIFRRGFFSLPFYFDKWTIDVTKRS